MWPPLQTQLGVASPFQITKESKLTLGFAYTEGTSAYTKQGSAAKAVNSFAVGRGVVLNPATMEDMCGTEVIEKPSLEVVYEGA